MIPLQPGRPARLFHGLGGVRNADDLMRNLVNVEPNELKQPKKKPLKRKPKK